MQEVIVAPVSRNRAARIPGGEEMFVIRCRRHPEADRCLNIVFRRAIVPERVQVVGNCERNVMINMETDRHDQAGGSLAARCPSIATRARRSVR